jgi:hypothetical protein
MGETIEVPFLTHSVYVTFGLWPFDVAAISNPIQASATQALHCHNNAMPAPRLMGLQSIIYSGDPGGYPDTRGFQEGYNQLCPLHGLRSVRGDTHHTCTLTEHALVKILDACKTVQWTYVVTQFSVASRRSPISEVISEEIRELHFVFSTACRDHRSRNATVFILTYVYTFFCDDVIFSVSKVHLCTSTWTIYSRSLIISRAFTCVIVKKEWSTGG